MSGKILKRTENLFSLFIFAPKSKTELFQKCQKPVKPVEKFEKPVEKFVNLVEKFVNPVEKFEKPVEFFFF